MTDQPTKERVLLGLARTAPFEVWQAVAFALAELEAIRDLISKYGPGGTGLGQTNAQGAAASSQGLSQPETALPVGKNPTPGNPGPFAAQRREQREYCEKHAALPAEVEEAMDVLLGAIKNEAQVGLAHRCGPGKAKVIMDSWFAALATIRAALAKEPK